MYPHALRCANKSIVRWVDTWLSLLFMRTSSGITLCHLQIPYCDTIYCTLSSIIPIAFSTIYLFQLYMNCDYYSKAKRAPESEPLKCESRSDMQSRVKITPILWDSHNLRQHSCFRPEFALYHTNEDLFSMIFEFVERKRLVNFVVS